MQQAKSLITSWTVWFGILQIVSAGIGFLAGQLDQGAALTLATTGITTIGLRMKTNSPISSVI